jgi:hypothetical protein
MVSGSGRVYLTDGGRWLLRAECGDCSGYVLDLCVAGHGGGDTARARADAYMRNVHEVGCPACDTLERLARSDDAPLDTEVWWNPRAGEWHARFGIPGGSEPVFIGLGVHTYWARREAEAAAALMDQGVPLRVVAHREDLEPGAFTVLYDASTSRWVMHAGCAECGGCDLPLLARGRGAIDQACAQARRCLERILSTECPHCRSLRERSVCRDPDAPPVIWYDTLTGDWLAWQPLTAGGVTLPIGVGRYDADERQVLRAAARLHFDDGLDRDDLLG